VEAYEAWNRRTLGRAELTPELETAEAYLDAIGAKKGRSLVKQPLQVLMSLAAQAQSEISQNPADGNAVIMSLLPDAVRAFSELQASKEAEQRSHFVASHAISLLHTVIETTEDDSQLRDYAKRAVRLSALVLEESEKLVNREGLKGV
jgi:hypothetical protein